MKIVSTKETTINTGDYSNVRCGVTLEIDNVQTKDFTKVNKLLKHITYQMWCLDFASIAEDVINLTESRKKSKEFISFLIGNINIIEKDLQTNIDHLQKMGYEI